MSGLAIVKQVERARVLLAESKTLDEVLLVHDKARALQTYATLREKGSAAHADAWELCRLAERRLGELTRELPKAQAGRKKSVTAATDSPGPKPKGEVLRELNLPRQLVAKAERVAGIAPAAFNDRLAAGRDAVERGKAPPNLAAASRVGRLKVKLTAGETELFVPKGAEQLSFPAVEKVDPQRQDGPRSTRPFGFDSGLLGAALRACQHVAHCVAWSVPEDPHGPFRLDVQPNDSGIEGFFVVMPMKLNPTALEA